MSSHTEDVHGQLPAKGVYVVTGAGSGIGASVCQQLIAANQIVVGVDITWSADEDKSAEIGNELFFPMNCDVSNWGQVRELAAHVSDKFGSVVALVNCAGIGLWFSPVADTPVEDWDRVIKVNLTGPFFLAKAFLPSLIESQGAILLISSVHGVATVPGCGAYASSKSGLFGLTKSLAVDYGAKGVRTNCLVLGSVNTEMTRSYEVSAKMKGITDLEIPSWQRAESSDVATVVEFMLSKNARFMNGSLLTIDGGLLSHL